MARALATFDSAVHNQGRANLYAMGAGCVVVDYGHNPAAFTASAELGARWPGPVVGVVGVPGDRRDDVVLAAARAAAGAFDRLYVREDEDLRGRAPGAVAALMLAEVARVAPRLPCEHVGDALDALHRLAPEVAAGAMLVFYYERFAELHEALLALGARPMSSLAAMTQGAGAVPAPAESPTAGG